MTERAKKVLVVDDDRNVTDLLDAVLRYAGCGVTIARSGREALARASVDPPDVIVLDVVLPGMNGWETCRQIRAAEPIGRAPVYFITGRNDPDDELTCRQAGGTAILRKPFEVADLLACLGNAPSPSVPGSAVGGAT